MAALSTKVDVTAVTELVPTELIGTFVQEYEYTPRAAEAVAWAEPGVGSIVRRFPRWEQLDGGSGVPAGTKTETDTFTDVTLTAAENSITPGLVGFRMPLSDEAVAAFVGEGGLPASAIEAGLDGLLDRMDSDGLSSSTSATNTSGAATDNFTLAKFRAAAAAYRALKIPAAPMGSAFIGHFDAFRDLEESAGASAAVFAATELSSQMFGSMPGFKGSYHGFSALFESGNVPAESGGWSNGMTPIGQRVCGLGYVITERPNVRPTRGDDAENRAVTYLVTRAWYGTGLTNPNRYLEVLSRT